MGVPVSDGIFAGREIIVGVTAGLAAYKAAALTSLLVQQGAGVTAVLTRNARKFIGEATFAALTGRPVATRGFDPSSHPLGAHIELAARADCIVVAPASADFLAKAAQGSADDLLTTLLLCAECPVVFAPAMNAAMWAKPAVQRNVAQVAADEARMDARYRRTSILTAGDGDDLHLRVAEEDLEQFQGGVARGTEDGDFDHRDSSRGIDPAVL